MMVRNSLGGGSFGLSLVAAVATVVVLGAHADALAALAKPGSPSAVAVSSQAIACTWGDTNSTETGYVIERSLKPRVGFAVAGTVAAGVTSYVDAGLVPATPYYYRVRATGPGGTKSFYSTVVSATTLSGGGQPTPLPSPVPTATPDQLPPTVPTGVTAAPTSCSQVAVAWLASTDGGGSGLRGYNLYRDGTLVRFVSAPGLSTTDTGLTGSTRFSYAVRAVDNAGNSSLLSMAVSVNTPACPNQPPVASAGPDLTIRAGLVASFSAAGSFDPDGTITSYAWDFGDATMGSGTPVLHTFATAGSYVVRLTVTDSSGGTGTDTAIVTVTPGTALGQWSRAIGGSGSDFGNAVAVDRSSNVVAAGTFSSSVDFGAGALTSAGGTDVFLARFSPTGSLSWAKRIGGVGADVGEAVAVDPNGNAVVVGSFSGSVNFGGEALTATGPSDIFVAMYSSAGALLWARRFGNSYASTAYGVAVDATGNVFVTGAFKGSVGFGGVVLNSVRGGLDTFVVKLSSSGDHIWSRNFANNGDDSSYAIAVGPDGNPVLTGYFLNSIDLGSGTMTSATGFLGSFVAKLNGTTGALVWAQQLSCTQGVVGYAVGVGRSNEVAVTGLFDGTATVGGAALVGAGGNDVFVAIYSSDGAPLWARRMGDWGRDIGQGIGFDATGNVLVTGQFERSVDFGGGPLSSVAFSDAFIAKYSPTGVHLWSRRFGGNSNDAGMAIAVDVSGRPVVTGYFWGTGDLGGGPVVSNGLNDILVSTIAP